MINTCGVVATFNICVLPFAYKELNKMIIESGQCKQVVSIRTY